MQISFESPNQRDAIALIAELDAYQSALYPPESHHALDLASVAEQGLLFVLARDHAGQAVGCGAVVLSTEYGELKRMYVRPQQRDQEWQQGYCRRWKRRPWHPLAAC